MHRALFRRLLPWLAPLFFIAGLGAQTTPAPVPTAFQFEPNGFKYINHDAEFRVSSDLIWPNFYCGRPAPGGVLLLGPTPSINLTVAYAQMLQTSGDQSRKVLGELCSKDQFPAVSLTLNRLSGLEQAPATGKKRKGDYYTARFDGIVQIGERRVPVKPQGEIALIPNKAGVTDRVMIVATATFKPADLGLKKLPPDTVITARFVTNGTPGGGALAPKK